MSVPEEHYTKQVKIMTFDEGFILRPEEAKARIESKGFTIVMIKDDNGNPIVLARPEDIPEIQKIFHGRYHVLDQLNAEY